MSYETSDSDGPLVPREDAQAVARLVMEAKRRERERGLTFCQALDAVRMEAPEIFDAGTRHFGAR